MTKLVTYRSTSGERELVFVTVPEDPRLTLLLDVPSSGVPGDDVAVVDENLTTIAEARLIARGWAAERASDPQTVTVVPAERPVAHGSRTKRVIARYSTAAEHRLLIGERIKGEACLLDVPADEAAGGPVHLVARNLVTRRELDALVADYLAQCAARGTTARHADALLIADLAGAAEGRR
jgi:hypothetical protein